MNNPWHPDDSELIPWVDGELEGAQSETVGRHVAGCAECRRKTEEVRSAYTAYRSHVRATSPPPQPWPALKPQLRQLDGPMRVIRPRPRLRVPVWAAAAAAVVIGVVVLRVSTGGPVSAAELLRDASAAESRATPPKQIRVRTRSAVFTRPASKGVESDLASLFRKADYSWEEPLSARTFAKWRSGLREKDDRVRMFRDGEYGRGRFYRITTTTPKGELAEASITIRAEDLRAVHERLTFRNEEWVEITEDVEEPAPLKPLPPVRLADRESSQPAREITASDELRVVAALHDIGADLGDPVEVTAGPGRILVSALAPDPERQSQIRAALSGLPFVELRFEQPEAVRNPQPLDEPAAAEAPNSNALIDRLAIQLGSRSTVENFTNHVLDLSEAALARAHALRSLAARFGPDREEGLAPGDRATLHRMQSEHARHLLASVRQLSEVLKPVAPSTAASRLPADAFASWQSGTDEVLKAAQKVDRVVTNALAGTGAVDNPDSALQRLAAAASDLHARAAALQTTVAAHEAR